MLNSFQYSLPADLLSKFTDTLSEWETEGKIGRIWAKDATVWTNADESKWLGWLDVIPQEQANADKYRAFRSDIDAAGFTDVLLMGMGGSSLCPEVLAKTFGKLNFHILDSTVPEQVLTVESRINVASTLFIVASKSGSTLEPNCFKQYFFDRVVRTVGRESAGRQFVAITDPGSKMEKAATEDGFRYIFYGKPEIGGRFSALSAFGMTAAASMGVHQEQLLASAAEMAQSCKAEDPHENPGALLGTLLGICHAAGRDKLTIFTSPEIRDTGAWLEQLIAESTGKNGVAIIPVDREMPQDTAKYGHDRVFAFLILSGDNEFRPWYSEIIDAGHPAVIIELENLFALSQEFFRWEFATAVAGSLMGINPFDQPDVESAKIEARKLTDEYEEKGELPPETPFFESDSIQLFAGPDYSAELIGESGDEPSAASIIDAHLSKITEGDYFALLAYIEMNPEHDELLQMMRSSVLERFECATCLGFGPRFLHSTGQAYKGGGNNGVFLQVTSEDATDVPVPGQKFTFGVVKAAQARGDFQVLVDRGRRALRVHLRETPSAGLAELAVII